MEQGIKELIDISQFYGKDKEYVIAGGGNTSFKDNNYLWIKASGVALSDISEDGFVKMSREKLKVISERTYSSDSNEREEQVKNDLAAAVVSKDGKRPSVETSMHDVIDYPFVVHTHPTVVNSISCSKNAEKTLRKVLGDDVLFIGYIDPGYVLFKKVADEIDNFKKSNGFVPKVILLENHGIFVSSNTVEEIKSIYADIERKILNYAGLKLPDDTTSSFDIDGLKTLSGIYESEMNVVTRLCTNEIILDFVHDEKSFSAIATAFTPDHIVYCKSKYLFLDAFNPNSINEEIKSFVHQFGFLPRIIGIKNKGLIIAGDSEKSVGIILELITNMIKISWLARKFDGSKPMTKEQIAFIENWEVENYRKKMAQ
jgi:rhamnose utilization protein RhaD (predicted bifunctional aldolase and dehydrogenase)